MRKPQLHPHHCFHSSFNKAYLTVAALPGAGFSLPSSRYTDSRKYICRGHARLHCLPNVVHHNKMYLLEMASSRGKKRWKGNTGTLLPWSGRNTCPFCLHFTGPDQLACGHLINTFCLCHKEPHSSCQGWRIKGQDNQLSPPVQMGGRGWRQKDQDSRRWMGSRQRWARVKAWPSTASPKLQCLGGAPLLLSWILLWNEWANAELLG